MRDYRLSQHAEADLISVLAWSQGRFGEHARLRYEALLVAAIRHIRTDPERLGSALRPELGPDVRVWHLRLSRARSGVDRVSRPRHVLIYRTEDDGVVIGRVLHDSVDLAQHVDADTTWN